MSETPKQKAIREAYSLFWESSKDFIDDDGWFNMSNADNVEGISILWDICDRNGTKIRPKSLKGIENNNGWLSVVEHGLPKKWDYHLDYHVFDNEGYISTRTFTVGSEDYWKAHVTHYQPVVKPSPPIY